MPEVEVVVEVSAENTPSVLPVGTVVVGPGTTEITWTLITINQHNTHQATFSSSAIQFLGTHPSQIVPTQLVTGATVWRISIENKGGMSAEAHHLNYTIHYMFNGQTFTEDPVIVVTSEPVPPLDPIIRS